MAYIWLWTFGSRFIRLYEDKLSIRNAGSRHTSRTVSYSDIESIEVAPKSPGYWITLRLKKKKPLLLLSENEMAVIRLKELFEAATGRTRR
jgi:hypothetical protein